MSIGVSVSHIISTHAPRMGSDVPVGAYYYGVAKFQPTLPVWGATYIPILVYNKVRKDFNPRSPYGERLTVPSVVPSE